jgi:hypothetical protein
MHGQGVPASLVKSYFETPHSTGAGNCNSWDMCRASAITSDMDT